MDKTILKTLLETEDRSPHWLSKKINCSHTLVYKWLKGSIKISPSFTIKINKIFRRWKNALDVKSKCLYLCGQKVNIEWGHIANLVCHNIIKNELKNSKKEREDIGNV